MAAFSTIAAVGLGAAGIGASVIGSKKQASAVTQAAESSDATNRYIYDDIKQRSAYRESMGNQALGKLGGMYGLGQGQQQGATVPAGFTGFGTTGGNSFGFGAAPNGGGNPINYGGGGGNRIAPQFGFQNNPAPAQQAAQPFADFYNSPDYQLAFNEGQSAIEGGAAARGGLLSGNTAKAVTQYGQDIATSTFGNYKNTLNNIAGIGQQASNTISNAGQNYANQYGNNQMAIGNARANSAGQIAGAIGGAAGFGLGAIGQNKGWF